MTTKRRRAKSEPAPQALGRKLQAAGERDRTDSRPAYRDRRSRDPHRHGEGQDRGGGHHRGGGDQGQGPPTFRVPVRPAVEAAVGAPRWTVSCNPGLVMDRFAPSWSSDPRKTPGGPEKKVFLDQVAGLLRGLRARDKALLASFRKRRREWLNSLEQQGWKTETIPLRLDRRLISGLGISHPFETGFVFEHTYGLPYLSGSSVKGVARRAEAEDSPLARVVVGSWKSGCDPGCVVFFDAFPTEWPLMEVDVLTPHDTDYYEGKCGPVDWLSPSPVYFLTVAPGARFEFALGVPPDLDDERLKAARAILGLVSDAPVVEVQGKLIGQAKRMLVDAATGLGMGAKTAVDYGYFVP